jgi:flagellar biosynthesis/type III secretory pathway protein FliH
MIRRMDVTGSPLVPWQFPDLDGPARREAIPHLPRAEETGTSAAAADETAALPSEGASGGADDPPLGDIVAAEILKGHAEGLQRGLQEGRESGYAEGFATGAQAAEQAHAETAHRLAAIIEGLSAPIPALDRTIEDAVVSLALEIARCVIGSEVSRSREYLVRLIREAIAKVPIEMGALEVVLNPADLDLVRALAPEIAQGSTALIGDAAVEAGGCLVIGHNETRDTRWQPRLREGLSQVDLSLAERWRNVMLTLFDGEAE